MTGKPEAEREAPWGTDEFPSVQFATFGSCHLLAGHAIENLIKCCLENVGWDTKFETHATLLAAKWGIEFSPEEMAFLKDAKDSIEWKAKYPLPKKPPHPASTGHTLGPGFLATLGSIWTKLFDALEARDLHARRFLVISMVPANHLERLGALPVFDALYEITKARIRNVGRVI